MLKEKNQELLGGTMKQSKLTLNVGRLGTTKTNWANFDDIVKSIDRAHEHIMSFITTELGAEASFGPDMNLIIQGVYKLKVIEKLYNKYLDNYVKCGNCRDYNTKLEKDPATRLFMMECKQCGSTRSVANIRAGYHAYKRGERKKERQ